VSRRPLLALAFALAFALLGAGCATPLPQDDDPELLELEASLAKGDDFDTRWQAAKACLELVESPTLKSSSRKLDYAQRALEHAEAAIALDNRRVEGHYYRAYALGLVLDNSTLPTRGKMLELEKSGKKAHDIDPAFDDAAPCLLLALLYQKAPPWPFGPELAREEDVIEGLFKQAIEHAPHCAENYLCYAEFLTEQEREHEARKMAERARDALKAQTELPPYERLDRSRRIRAILGTGKVSQARD